MTDFIRQIILRAQARSHKNKQALTFSYQGFYRLWGELLQQKRRWR